MGKDLVKTDKSSEAKTDQTKNIVDKILKTKNYKWNWMIPKNLRKKK